MLTGSTDGDGVVVLDDGRAVRAPASAGRRGALAIAVHPWEAGVATAEPSGPALRGVVAGLTPQGDRLRVRFAGGLEADVPAAEGNGLSAGDIAWATFGDEGPRVLDAGAAPLSVCLMTWPVAVGRGTWMPGRRSTAKPMLVASASGRMAIRRRETALRRLPASGRRPATGSRRRARRASPRGGTARAGRGGGVAVATDRGPGAVVELEQAAVLAGRADRARVAARLAAGDRVQRPRDADVGRAAGHAQMAHAAVRGAWRGA